MFRYLFVAITVFPLLLLNTVSTPKKEELTITLNVPATAKPGSSFDVEITIQPGEVEGFAKLTQILPKGYNAEAIDVGPATFSFDKGQIKIIWLSLPKEKEFTLSYRVDIDPKASGELSLGGKFAYLMQNERQTYSILKKKVMVGNEKQLAAKNQGGASAGAGGDGAQAGAPSVSVTRSILPSTVDKYTVELSIKKQGIEGFAKIQEFIPMGAKASEISAENAVFSFINKKVKFVWMSIPPEGEYTVSYLLDLSGASNKDPETAIKGDFSYLEGDVTKKVSIQNADDLAAGEVLASNEASGNDNQSDAGSSSGSTESNTGSGDEGSTNSSSNTTADNSGTEGNNNTSGSQGADNNATAQNTNTATSGSENTGGSEEDNTTTARVENENSGQQDGGNEKMVANTGSDSNKKEGQKENTGSTEVAQNQTSSDETRSNGMANQENNNGSANQENQQDHRRVQNDTQGSDSGTSGNNTVSASSGNYPPAPQSGLNYRVQIAAGKNLVNAQYFQKRHAFSKEFFIENHEGWVKYTTGTYGIYKDARDSRNEIRSAYNFDGPFVTAYSEGTRITVQEALMISKQKWYK